MAELVWQTRPIGAVERAGEMRAPLALVLAVAIHCIPVLWLTLPTPIEQVDDSPVSVEFEPGEPTAPETTQSVPKVDEPPVPPKTQEQSKIAEAAPAKPEIVPPPPPAVAIVPPPPVPQAKPAPPVIDEPAKPAPPPPAVAQIDKSVAAFDESKIKGTPPKDAYLSDRNSSAADRGPKNLPRGDPYMDKGQSKLIRYQEKRGEGNVPPDAASAASGSIKTEGSPDAGKGAPVEKLVEEKIARAPEIVKAPEKQHTVETDAEKTGKALAPKTEEIGASLNPADRPPQKLEKKTPPIADVDGPDPVKSEQGKDAEFVPPPSVEKTGRKAHSEAELADAAKPAHPKIDSNDELAAFQALLKDSSHDSGNGGTEGTKPGINARAGQKGHEGDGSKHAGHDEAVSDVMTLNLESSADEVDDSRFAKRFDPKTMYLKKVLRRIDTKWKAAIVARGRMRIVMGVVAMKMVIRKDGTLIEASEVKRDPSSIPDEYVALAKLAIQRANDPIGDPFPAELRQQDSIENVFEFIYH